MGAVLFSPVSHVGCFSDVEYPEGMFLCGRNGETKMYIGTLCYVGEFVGSRFSRYSSLGYLSGTLKNLPLVSRPHRVENFCENCRGQL